MNEITVLNIEKIEKGKGVMGTAYIVDSLKVRIKSAWIAKDWDEVIRLRKALDDLEGPAGFCPNHVVKSA